MSKLFVVGQVTNEELKTWDFQGVFSTEEKAVAACRDWTYFVGPADLDAEVPHETAPEWPGAFFPIARTEA